MRNAQKTDIAQQLGTNAFAAGIQAPVLDPEMMDLLKGLKVGEGIPLLKAWIKGWTLARLLVNA